MAVDGLGLSTWVVGFTVVKGRIAALDLIGDPAKVRGFSDQQGAIE